MMVGDAILRINSLEAGYSDSAVLRGATMELRAGEIAGLIGPNGAGKTTALRCMAGLLGFRSGSLSVLGLDVKRAAPVELRLAGLGYVPQERNVFPNLSVSENLETAYRAAGKGAAAVNLGERLAFVEDLFPRLAERRKQIAGLMSGGEQRMLALAMGLVLKPRALLLDEPTTGLAPLVVHQLMNTIQRLRKSDGISILLVEQNIASLLKIVDRLYVMKEGVCREFEGDPRELERQNIWEYL
jgi:branched-chain amino acid transport system ATP-binding protein